MSLDSEQDNAAVDVDLSEPSEEQVKSTPRQDSARSARDEPPAQQVIREEPQDVMEERGGGGGDGEEGDEDLTFAQGLYNAQDMNDQIFEPLVLEPEIVQVVQQKWTEFMDAYPSREACGEAIFSAIFEASPALQTIFKSPRAVIASRFIVALNTMMSMLGDPKSLKVQVETLGFQHLDSEVSILRASVFRDVIIDLIAAESGNFTRLARDGFMVVLNYIGGSLIYIRVNYADRLRILASSWATANSKANEELAVVGEDEFGIPVGEDDPEAAAEGPGEASAKVGANQGNGKGDGKDGNKKKAGNNWGGLKGNQKGDNSGDGEGQATNTSIPQTFDEMFLFNAAVMGYGSSLWMHEILSVFDNIVSNVSNSYRMQEECELLALVLDKYKGEINLPEFKAVMLASLRSLVPKDWDSAHEVAWGWLWENLERLVKGIMGKPLIFEKNLMSFYNALEEPDWEFLREEVYVKFFLLAPAGMDHFKQSTTRLRFIASKVATCALELYQDTQRMKIELSALGLRHVGYGIPSELFAPLVTAWVQVIQQLTDSQDAVEAFRWSLSLNSRILMRVVNEGSTIVMKAINVNSAKLLKRAVACAPRGKRAVWMLNVQVGAQSISPLQWAIETGSLESAKAIIADLLSIRADRDRYYYGMDELFRRHPDIIKILGIDAPVLLPTLLDGLIWRSRLTENGQRRVNYYVKHLVMDEDGSFSKTIEWITDRKDPKIVCHPVVVLVTDLVWTRVAFKSFLFGKIWFLFTLIIFILSQSILNHVTAEERAETGKVSLPLRLATFICRVFIFACSLGQWIFYHANYLLMSVRSEDYIQVSFVKVPAYLAAWQDVCSLALTVCLLIMLFLEPVLHCVPNAEYPLLSSNCPEGRNVAYNYSIVSAVAMLMYYVLLIDLSVFSTRVSAFVLVCGRVLSEVAQFLFALCFFALAFAAAVGSLEQYDPDFTDIPKSFLQFIKITFGMFRGAHWEMVQDWPVLLIVVFCYVITSIVFLLNLLVAQLNCLYQTTYMDMLGYARLNRGKIVVDTMPSVSRSRWESFVENLKLDEKVEFGEGDIGLPGGMQVFEPAGANPTTVEMITRYGGSTSPAAQWPEDTTQVDEEDRFEKLEKLVEKSMKKLTAVKGKGSRHGTNSGGGSADHNSSLEQSKSSASETSE